MDRIDNALEDRDISYLRFNKRILEEAMDASTPLLERLHFLSIFCKNLDEFFMTRVGILIDELSLKKDEENKAEKRGARETFENTDEYVRGLLLQKDAAFDDIIQQMKSRSVKMITPSNVTAQEQDYLRSYFEKQISHVLSPMVVDKKSLPFIKNRQMIVAASLESKTDWKAGIVPIQTTLPRIILVPNMEKLMFILIENLIVLFIDGIFDRHTITDKAIIRITRNADIDENDVLCDNDIDFKESIITLIRKRAKMEPIRMECMGEIENDAINNIRKALDLEKKQIYCQNSPLDMNFIQELKTKLAQQKYNALYYAPLTPRKTGQINENEPMIDQIKKKDLLMSFPFEDIAPFIRLLNEAGADPRVKSIKITLYRVAENSKIIDSLIMASKNGKDVLCVIELRAKFDETENIEWTKKLEIGGCKVVFGLPEFKNHAKMLLITMDNGNTQEYITQIGTGNYNETTAMVYCDLSLLTANPEIGMESGAVFEKLQEGKFIENTMHLLVAPLCFENRIVELIDHEIEKAKKDKSASIILKINGLTDKSLMKKLVEASQAGVKIQLIVRDICCLKGGVEGISENVTVRSIVGRFLEHSRIYKFGEGSESRVYISSADLMTRNTAHRVEIAIPIYDMDCKAKIDHLLDRMLKDHVKARMQLPDGKYALPQIGTVDKPLNYQIAMFEQE